MLDSLGAISTLRTIRNLTKARHRWELYCNQPSK